MIKFILYYHSFTVKLEAWSLQLIKILAFNHRLNFPDPRSNRQQLRHFTSCVQLVSIGSGIRVEHLVSRPFLTSWFHQWPVTKKPVRLRLYFCLLNLIPDPRYQHAFLTSEGLGSGISGGHVLTNPPLIPRQLLRLMSQEPCRLHLILSHS